MTAGARVTKYDGKSFKKNFAKDNLDGLEGAMVQYSPGNGAYYIGKITGYKSHGRSASFYLEPCLHLKKETSDDGTIALFNTLGSIHVIYATNPNCSHKFPVDVEGEFIKIYKMQV